MLFNLWRWTRPGKELPSACGEPSLSQVFKRRTGESTAQIPKEEFILETTSACPGCSSSLSLRYILKAAGPDTVLVIPASCSSVIQGMYPNTAVNVPVYNIAFAAAASCASGMSAGLRRAGRDTKVIVYAGDGGTVDIGLQALSGALERETDFLYICYDNEAYGNTGMQRSGSTPLGALTTTTPSGKIHPKKEIRPDRGGPPPALPGHRHQRLPHGPLPQG